MVVRVIEEAVEVVGWGGGSGGGGGWWRVIGEAGGSVYVCTCLHAV